MKLRTSPFARLSQSCLGRQSSTTERRKTSRMISNSKAEMKLAERLVTALSLWGSGSV